MRWEVLLLLEVLLGEDEKCLGCWRLDVDKVFMLYFASAYGTTVYLRDQTPNQQGLLCRLSDSLVSPSIQEDIDVSAVVGLIEVICQRNDVAVGGLGFVVSSAVKRSDAVCSDKGCLINSHQSLVFQSLSVMIRLKRTGVTDGAQGRVRVIGGGSSKVLSPSSVSHAARSTS